MITEVRDSIRVRLSEIEMANGGRLTPSAVVEDAKDPSSPLHGSFEWDVTKASAAHWIEQARRLITSIYVSQRVETTSVRAVYYVRDPSAGSDEQGYVSLPTVRTDADLAREVLIAEFTRVADLLRRARVIAVALGAQGDVETLLSSVVGLRQRFVDGPATKQ